MLVTYHRATDSSFFFIMAFGASKFRASTFIACYFATAKRFAYGILGYQYSTLWGPPATQAAAAPCYRWLAPQMWHSQLVITYQYANGGLGEGAVGPGSPRSYSANYIYGRGAPEGPRFHMRLRAP